MIEAPLWVGAVVAFLIGSIPFAVLAMAGSGVDIRRVGSGNPGFNNVLRVNKKRAILTLIGDLGKGFLAVWLFYGAGDPIQEGWLYGFSAVFGHCYTPWLGFNGGKGIATSAGIMLRLYPPWAAIGLAVFFVLRILGSRRKWPEAGAIASVSTWVFFSLILGLYESPLAARNAALMTVFLAWRHKSNLRRLMGR